MRVLYTDNALYIGVLCHDRSPREIVSTQLTRDAELDVDDRILIVLDPFFDHRNGFFFEVNPAGPGPMDRCRTTPSASAWNGTAFGTPSPGSQTRDGSPKIEIPFKTLRFKPGQTTWGFNVERQIKRRQEIDRWTAARQNIWIGNLAEAGRLEGLEGVQQGRGLDLRPHASVAADNGDRRICARRGCLQEPDTEPQRGHHRQHRLRGDRSRSPAGEPDAFSTLLPREARVLPGRRRRVRRRRVWSTPPTSGRSSAAASACSRTSPCQFAWARS